MLPITWGFDVPLTHASAVALVWGTQAVGAGPGVAVASPGVDTDPPGVGVDPPATGELLPPGAAVVLQLERTIIRRTIIKSPAYKKRFFDCIVKTPSLDPDEIE